LGCADGQEASQLGVWASCLSRDKPKEGSHESAGAAEAGAPVRRLRPLFFY
jgi:hypothetical protein